MTSETNNKPSSFQEYIKAAKEQHYALRIRAHLFDIKMAQHFPDDQALAKQARDAQMKILELDTLINSEKLPVANRPSFYVSRAGVVTTSLDTLRK